MLVKGNDKMRIEKELCQKFPTVLKDKLLKLKDFFGKI